MADSGATVGSVVSSHLADLAVDMVATQTVTGLCRSVLIATQTVAGLCRITLILRSVRFEHNTSASNNEISPFTDSSATMIKA